LDGEHRAVAILRQIPSDSRTELDAEALLALVKRQHGTVSRRQLRRHGLSGTMIARWLQARRLHRIHHHVYAVGHTALPLEGRLWAALLYAGPGAILSHMTAGWAWGLIDVGPRRIHVTTAGRRSSLPDVRVHQSRKVDPVEHRGLPVTSVPRTLLDLAGVLSARQLRRALAEADYRGLLDPAEVESVLGRGRPGSRSLNLALAHHLPSLARTLSELEERFLELCHASNLRFPRSTPESAACEWTHYGARAPWQSSWTAPQLMEAGPRSDATGSARSPCGPTGFEWFGTPGTR
jgi:hypothetical protein